MKKYILIYLYITLSIVATSCQKSQTIETAEAMLFSVKDAETKAFINDLNRSGNQVVLFDYMKKPDYTPADQSDDEYEWYIDHKRIHCEVDGQQVWDFVDGDEYYWLDSSVHNCFGWLYMGPSGTSTESFFGSHPDINKETCVLTLPAYEFTLNSPLYDFMYSDVYTRSFSRSAPDTSPIGLDMKHLFSSFRIRAKNVRPQTTLTINSVTLSVKTKKQASIDFSKAKDNSKSVQVTYNDVAGAQSIVRSGLPLQLEGGEDFVSLFANDVDTYHMIWPQSQADITAATLQISYSLNGDKTVAIPLANFGESQWEAGKRYSYDLVFTDEHIQLTCNVEDWTRRTIDLTLSDVVVVSDKIQWDESTVMSVNEHNGQVVVKKSNNQSAEAEPAVCYFKITQPEGCKWYADLIGDSDAFEFVKRNATGTGYEVNATVFGDVGKLAELLIRAKKTNEQYASTKTAVLRIHIILPDGSKVVVENLCAGHDFHEYTLVRDHD